MYVCCVNACIHTVCTYLLEYSRGGFGGLILEVFHCFGMYNVLTSNNWLLYETAVGRRVLHCMTIK